MVNLGLFHNVFFFLGLRHTWSGGSEYVWKRKGPGFESDRTCCFSNGKYFRLIIFPHMLYGLVSKSLSFFAVRNLFTVDLYIYIIIMIYIIIYLNAGFTISPRLSFFNVIFLHV